MRLNALTTAIALTLFTASYAAADPYVSPWAGVNFGTDIDNGRGAFGVRAGAMGGGAVGGEINVGFSPSFFGTENDFGNNTVLDVMANLIVGIPIGGQSGPGFRPFVTGGLGLIRTQIDGGDVFDASFSNNDFGWNAGAGVMGYFNDHVGLRLDVTYLRNFNGDSLDTLDLGNLHYWRAGLGLVIR